MSINPKEDWSYLPSILHINYPRVHFYRKTYIDVIPMVGVVYFKIYFDHLMEPKPKYLPLTVYGTLYDDVTTIGPKMVREMGIRLLLNTFID